MDPVTAKSPNKNPEQDKPALDLDPLKGLTKAEPKTVLEPKKPEHPKQPSLEVKLEVKHQQEVSKGVVVGAPSAAPVKNAKTGTSTNNSATEAVLQQQQESFAFGQSKKKTRGRASAGTSEFFTALVSRAALLIANDQELDQAVESLAKNAAQGLGAGKDTLDEALERVVEQGGRALLEQVISQSAAEDRAQLEELPEEVLADAFKQIVLERAKKAGASTEQIDKLSQDLEAAIERSFSDKGEYLGVVPEPAFDQRSLVPGAEAFVHGELLVFGTQSEVNRAEVYRGELTNQQIFQISRELSLVNSNQEASKILERYYDQNSGSKQAFIKEIESRLKHHQLETEAVVSKFLAHKICTGGSLRFDDQKESAVVKNPAELLGKSVAGIKITQAHIDLVNWHISKTPLEFRVSEGARDFVRNLSKKVQSEQNDLNELVVKKEPEGSLADGKVEFDFSAFGLGKQNQKPRDPGVQDLNKNYDPFRKKPDPFQPKETDLKLFNKVELETEGQAKDRKTKELHQNAVNAAKNADLIELERLIASQPDDLILQELVKTELEAALGCLDSNTAGFAQLKLFVNEGLLSREQLAKELPFLSKLISSDELFFDSVSKLQVSENRAVATRNLPVAQDPLTAIIQNIELNPAGGSSGLRVDPNKNNLLVAPSLITTRDLDLADLERISPETVAQLRLHGVTKISAGSRILLSETLVGDRLQAEVLRLQIAVLPSGRDLVLAKALLLEKESRIFQAEVEQQITQLEKTIPNKNNPLFFPDIDQKFSSFSAKFKQIPGITLQFANRLTELKKELQSVTDSEERAALTELVVGLEEQLKSSKTALLGTVKINDAGEIEQTVATRFVSSIVELREFQDRYSKDHNLSRASGGTRQSVEELTWYYAQDLAKNPEISIELKQNTQRFLVQHWLSMVSAESKDTENKDFYNQGLAELEKLAALFDRNSVDYKRVEDSKLAIKSKIFEIDFAAANPEQKASLIAERLSDLVCGSDADKSLYLEIGNEQRDKFVLDSSLKPGGTLDAIVNGLNQRELGNLALRINGLPDNKRFEALRLLALKVSSESESYAASGDREGFSKAYRAYQLLEKVSELSNDPLTFSRSAEARFFATSAKLELLSAWDSADTNEAERNTALAAVDAFRRAPLSSGNDELNIYAIRLAEAQKNVERVNKLITENGYTEKYAKERDEELYNLTSIQAQIERVSGLVPEATEIIVSQRLLLSGTVAGDRRFAHAQELTKLRKEFTAARDNDFIEAHKAGADRNVAKQIHNLQSARIADLMFAEGLAYAKAGDGNQALEILKELEEQFGKNGREAQFEAVTERVKNIRKKYTAGNSIVAALEVGLDEMRSGGSIVQSVGLTGGFTLVGMGVGTFFAPGPGTVLGGLIGSGFGLVLDQGINAYSGRRKIFSAYESGWNDIETERTVWNTLGLGVDAVCIFLPLKGAGSALGRGGAKALLGFGVKQAGKETAEIVKTKALAYGLESGATVTEKTAAKEIKKLFLEITVAGAGKHGRLIIGAQSSLVATQFAYHYYKIEADTTLTLEQKTAAREQLINQTKYSLMVIAGFVALSKAPSIFPQKSTSARVGIDKAVKGLAVDKKQIIQYEVDLAFREAVEKLAPGSTKYLKPLVVPRGFRDGSGEGGGGNGGSGGSGDGGAGPVIDPQPNPALKAEVNPMPRLLREPLAKPPAYIDVPPSWLSAIAKRFPNNKDLANRLFERSATRGGEGVTLRFTAAEIAAAERGVLHIEGLVVSDGAGRVGSSGVGSIGSGSSGSGGRKLGSGFPRDSGSGTDSYSATGWQPGNDSAGGVATLEKPRIRARVKESGEAVVEPKIVEAPKVEAPPVIIKRVPEAVKPPAKTVAPPEVKVKPLGNSGGVGIIPDTQQPKVEIKRNPAVMRESEDVLPAPRAYAQPRELEPQPPESFELAPPPRLRVPKEAEPKPRNDVKPNELLPLPHEHIVPLPFHREHIPPEIAPLPRPHLTPAKTATPPAKFTETATGKLPNSLPEEAPAPRARTNPLSTPVPQLQPQLQPQPQRAKQQTAQEEQTKTERDESGSGGSSITTTKKEEKRLAAQVQIYRDTKTQETQPGFIRRRRAKRIYVNQGPVITGGITGRTVDAFQGETADVIGVSLGQSVTTKLDSSVEEVEE